jgi:hypothetical protein
MIHFYRDVMPYQSAKGTHVLSVRAVSISKVPIITHVLGMFAVSISRIPIITYVSEMLAFSISRVPIVVKG